MTVLNWIRSLPAYRYVPPPVPAVDFEFFRACVQNVFATPREGHIKCSNCHGGGPTGFAPIAGEGRTTWNDQEARAAFTVISRLIVAGDPVRNRFLLKPLHPDGGGWTATTGSGAGRTARIPSGRCWPPGFAASARAVPASLSPARTGGDSGSRGAGPVMRLTVAAARSLVENAMTAAGHDAAEAPR